MSWPEPTAFVWGLSAITTLGALLPLDVGQHRRDYIVLTIAATVVLPILGPRGLLLIWGSVAVAFALQRGGRWLPGTAVAITVGFSLAHPTYTWLLDRDYPFEFTTTSDLAAGWLTLVVAWTGTMSVRVVLHRISADAGRPAGRDGFDAFDSPLVPYLLPTVAGAPILAASIALYRQDDPWPALVMLLWCLPVYAACRFELHRQRLTRELRRAAESRQRLAAIGEVTARIVHQSRHQAGLMGWSLHRLRRLVGDPSDDAIAAVRDELDILTTAKQRIQETLDSELLHERRSADDCGIGTLTEAVRDVCAQLDDKARRRSIAIKMQVDPDVGATVAAGSLREALFNVVDNASDAATALVQVTVPARSPGDAVLVEVHDDGAGVSDEAVTRLYEPFFSTKADGTGMGLAIADALVAELGGQLRHERRGDRTIFSLTVPADPNLPPKSRS